MPKSAWLEVFKTGTQTSSSGITKDYTEEDLDTMVSMYNGQTEHEAPLVIGHPETNDPAWGWVKELKRQGQKLMAFVDGVKDEVVESVANGDYKKVSIALYPNLLLRHVGLLGAAPPAVKGLASVQFSEQEFDEYVWATDEWRVPVIGRLLRGLRDLWISKFGLDEAEKALPTYDLDMLTDSAPSTMLTIPSPPAPIVPEENINVPPPGAITSSYSENPNKEEMEMTKEEIQEIVSTAVSAAMVAQDAKYGELQAQFSAAQNQITELATLITKENQVEIEKAKLSALDAKKLAFAESVDKLITEGKVLPAEKDSLLDEYAEMLKMEETIEYAEGIVPFSEKMTTRLQARPVLITKNRIFVHSKDAPEAKIEVPAQFADMQKIINPASIEINDQIESIAKEKGVSFSEAADMYCKA